MKTQRILIILAVTSVINLCYANAQTLMPIVTPTLPTQQIAPIDLTSGIMMSVNSLTWQYSYSVEHCMYATASMVAFKMCLFWLNIIFYNIDEYSIGFSHKRTKFVVGTSNIETRPSIYIRAQINHISRFKALHRICGTNEDFSKALNHIVDQANLSINPNLYISYDETNIYIDMKEPKLATLPYMEHNPGIEQPKSDCFNLIRYYLPKFESMIETVTMLSKQEIKNQKLIRKSNL